MAVFNFFPIVESVKGLKCDTIDCIKECDTIKGVKMLTQAYDILHITDQINEKYNNPVKEELVFDIYALKEFREIVSYLYLYNDPDRYIFLPYLNKAKRMMYYYQTWNNVSRS